MKPGEDEGERDVRIRVGLGWEGESIDWIECTLLRKDYCIKPFSILNIKYPDIYPVHGAKRLFHQ